jgi:uncharacterized membrane protein (DUF485 family)
MVTDISKRFTLWLSYSVLILLAMMVVAAIYNMRSSGSLDDLPAEEIRKAVNG